MILISICAIFLILEQGCIVYLLYRVFKNNFSIKLDGVESLEKFLNKFGDFKKPMIIERDISKKDNDDTYFADVN